MEYQTPQFIEVEDKIFGPLTLKQFIYLAGSGGICLLTYFTLPLLVCVLISIPVVAFGLSLAFYKLNGKPFIAIIEAAFLYFTSRRLYLWRKDTSPKKTVQVATKSTIEAERQTQLPKVTTSKLRDLAWSLDVQDHSLP